MACLKYKLLHKIATEPVYQKTGDSGFDLVSTEDCYIMPGETILVPFGIAFEIPHGYEIQIRPRSSVSLRGILLHLGTIDQGYRGEVKGIFTNLNLDSDRYFYAGDRVAQAVVCEVKRVSFALTQVLTETDRGAGGFGSTGK